MDVVVARDSDPGLLGSSSPQWLDQGREMVPWIWELSSHMSAGIKLSVFSSSVWGDNCTFVSLSSCNWVKRHINMVALPFVFCVHLCCVEALACYFV